MSKKFIYILAIAIFAVVAFVSYAVFINAQNETEVNIDFPITELGNCQNKENCRAYCNDPNNMPSCINFAKSHGLMNKEEASLAERFSQDLKSEGGPGGCKTPRECRTFCENLQNINVCVAYAKENGLKDKEIDQAEKIQSYLQSGGHTPGKCDSKSSCERYCGDFSHAQECYQFVKNAGITQRFEDKRERFDNEDGPYPENLQKLLELIKNGETPGKCDSKEDCETYCSDNEHMDECVAFAEKAGFVNHEQAEKFKQLEGKGPGECNSPQACRNYCNDQAHREECYKFAEEHGLIGKEDIEQTKKGLVQLRQGLENAPPEVAQCLKSTLGPNIIEDIQSGNLVPGPEIGQRVSGCFEKFGQRGDSKEFLSRAPKEMILCLKEKLRDDFEKISSGKESPTPEMADTFRVCSQNIKFERNSESGEYGMMSPDITNFLRSAPPEIRPCLKEKLGGDFEKIQTGENIKIDPSDIKSCFEKFRPHETLQKESDEKMMQREINFRQNFPPIIMDCLKNSLSQDQLNRIMSGDTLDISDVAKSCFSQSNTMPLPITNENPTQKVICPAMPTVESCPEGQRKEVVFSSPECGNYYGCVPVKQ